MPFDHMLSLLQLVLMCVCVCVSVVYSAVLHRKLTPSRVFTSLAIFQMLIFPLNAFPWIINGLIEAYVSLKRIENFLESEIMTSAGDPNNNSRNNDGDEDGGDGDGDGGGVVEVGKEDRGHNGVNVSHNCDGDGDGNTAAVMFAKECDVAFQKECVCPVLRDVNMSVNKGEVCVIEGSVGSGKSCLLLMCLGELQPSRGVCRHHGTLAYVSQQPCE